MTPLGVAGSASLRAATWGRRLLSLRAPAEYLALAVRAPDSQSAFSFGERYRFSWEETAQ